VIFTEHRDTLNYLEGRIATLLGRKEAVVCIHGSMGREDRMAVQESFRHDPEVQVLLATDAAGEGINLQRAHLMVNTIELARIPAERFYLELRLREVAKSV